MTQLVENIVLREGMVAIRWVLWSAMPENTETQATVADRVQFVFKGHLAGRLKGRLALAERIADAMHNVNTGAPLDYGREASATQIVELLRDEPDLSWLLRVSKVWADEVMQGRKTREDVEAELAKLIAEADPDTPTF